jgi:hypothetical protein
MAVSRRFAWWVGNPLAVFLPLQAALLFYNLSLLPIWGDEQFTLDVITRPWSEIPAVLRGDIHPPLYYFLARLWTLLPWPGSIIEQARAFSVLWCLLSTLLIYRLWVRRWRASVQFWFLLLWTLSPALVLYARMARSYSLQLFCGCLLLYAALRFLDNPSRKRTLLLFSLAAALTLYVHYLPGVALLSATAIDYCWRRRQNPAVYRWEPLLVSGAAIGLLYLPWAWTLIASLRRVAGSEAYRLTGNYAVEHAVRAAYWFVSFTFGESLPWGTILGGVLLTPLILWVSWKRLQDRAELFESSFGRLPVLAMAFAYLGTAMWVAVPFTPARSLFLLPFYLLWLTDASLQRVKPGHVVRFGLLLVWAGALGSYLQRDGFLNKGYLTPFDQMAAQIRNQSSPASTLVVIDGYNVDPKPVAAELCGDYHCIVVSSEEGQQSARRAAEQDRAEAVWYLRSTHDVSPGAIHGGLEEAFAGRYSVRRHFYLPYSQAERSMLRLIGWRDPPQHFYQMLEFRSGGSASPP